MIDHAATAEATVDRVVHWLRHPLAVRLAADWPHLPALFGPHLRRRIRDALDDDGTTAAPPLFVMNGGKPYHYPGSVVDMIRFVAGVEGCLPAIGRSLPPGSGAWDCGPPFPDDLAAGRGGRWPRMWCYWNEMDRRIRELRSGDSVVVHCDIRRCFGSVDRARLTGLLQGAGARADAVARLDRLMRSWESAGATGLPLLYVSRVLLKLYLREADERLLRDGARFFRLGDDYRFVCATRSEADTIGERFGAALAPCGLRENDRKRWVRRSGTLVDAIRRQATVWPARLKHGIFKPLLADSLQYPLLRPISLRLIRCFATPCRGTPLPPGEPAHGATTA